jgi:cytoskeletal protein CcmA (bactofilin family)
MADGSIIGQGTAIRGNVEGEGSLEIYGRVNGNVAVSGDVTLGPGAVVQGSITGSRLVIGGSVTGDLNGSEAVVLGATANVRGDLTAPRIGIEEGAELLGAVKTGVGTSPRAEARSVSRVEARPAVKRVEPEPTSRAAQKPPAPKKAPPAPVIPVMRRGSAKKKARRRE